MTAAFDAIAAGYDRTWSQSGAGMLQRQAVWSHVDRLIRPGYRILDLGCGTGEDALHFFSLGANVVGIDTSAEMVGRARAKGVEARVLPVERIAYLDDTFQLVFSNFGVLNCVRDLAGLRKPLAKLLGPNGYLALCVMNRVCLWETLFYATNGQFRKAGRRWSGFNRASLGIDVFYPRAKTIRNAFAPDFDQLVDVGIGRCVPPSFVPELPANVLKGLAAIDQSIQIGRSLADHRLLILRKVS